jgi:DNA-binding NarL/FixJ family response regulator
MFYISTSKLLRSREKQALRCYAKGLKRMQVAGQMGPSFHTISRMRNNLLAKSGVP